MSNRQKIEQQTNLLNAEWSTLRIQSIPLSTSGGALVGKRVWAAVITWPNFINFIFYSCSYFFSAAGAPTYLSRSFFSLLPRSRLFWLLSPDQACQTVLQMCTVEFGFPGFKAQAVAMRPLSTVAGIPFMYSWSPLQHNFMVWRSFLGFHILLLLLRPHFPLLKSTCCL